MTVAAMKQALDALEVCEQSDYGRKWIWPESAHLTAMGNVREAITSLRQAIAEAEKQDGDCQQCGGKGCVACDAREQEPVAWLYMEPNNPHINVHYDDVDRSQFPHDEWFPVYKQPKREWVGLTDEEIMEMLDYGQYGRVPQYARNFVEAVEAKLKEKNT